MPPIAPTPPIHLIDRVVDGSGLSERQRLELFARSGKRSLEELERALASCDRRLSDFRRFLDWGCGPGRVLLRVLESNPAIEVTGVDTDAGAIEWLTSAAPQASFHAIDPDPPIPLPAAGFDIVVSQSVLTHIDYRAQKAWFAEIGRLLRPGGIFVASVHGVHAFTQTLQQLEDGFADSNPWIEAWRANGFVFVAEDTWIGSSHHDGYHTTFQDPGRLEVVADHAFEVLAILPRSYLDHQDLVVLRRRTSEEAELRRSIGPAEHFEAAPPAAVDEDARLARLERAWTMASLSLNHLGRQVARIEDGLGRQPAAPRPMPQLIIDRLRRLRR